MLVLTRKLQQQIKIGEGITVTILRVKGHTVRVGIEAPRDVRVIRGELPPEGEEGAETQIIEAVVQVETPDGEETNTDDAVASGATKALGGSALAGASTRLPQRRPFNRYGVAPLRLAAGTQAVLAK